MSRQAEVRQQLSIHLPNTSSKNTGFDTFVKASHCLYTWILERSFLCHTLEHSFRHIVPIMDTHTLTSHAQEEHKNLSLSIVSEKTCTWPRPTLLRTLHVFTRTLSQRAVENLITKRAIDNGRRWEGYRWLAAENRLNALVGWENSHPPCHASSFQHQPFPDIVDARSSKNGSLKICR